MALVVLCIERCCGDVIQQPWCYHRSINEKPTRGTLSFLRAKAATAFSAS